MRARVRISVGGPLKAKATKNVRVDPRKSEVPRRMCIF